MSVLKFDGFEYGKHGDMVGIGSGIFTNANALITYEGGVAAARPGGFMGVRLAPAGTAINMATPIDPGGGSVTSPRTIRFYLYLLVAPSASAPLLRIMFGGTVRARLVMAAARTCTIQNITANTGIASAAFALNTLYRVDWSLDNNSAIQMINVYSVAADGTETAFWSTSGAMPGQPYQNVEVGVATAVSVTYLVDAFAITDNYAELGPYPRSFAGASLAA
jgi:hypothetical protein